MSTFVENIIFFLIKRGILKVKKAYTNIGRAWRWTYYTTFPSILTYVVACFYDLFLDYTFKQALARHFLEFILMVFAIAFSLYGLTQNKEINLISDSKEVYSNISTACCFLCFIFYGFFSHPSSKDKPIIMFILYIVFILFACVITGCGFRFELKTDHSSDR